MNTKYSFLVLFFFLLYVNTAFAESLEVGKVDYLQGVVSAKDSAGVGRLLDTESKVYKSDSVITGKNSFAILQLQDGTKITIRPSSVFEISEYEFNNNNQDKALFRLLKGGIRTVTGAINKNKADAVQLVTPVAQVTVDNAEENDFVARLCSDSCEEGKLELTDKKDTIAKVLLAQDTVHVKDNHGRHYAQVGYPLKIKDTVSTNEQGYAVLLFNDKTRLTVQPASELYIEEYVFPTGRPKQGKVLLDLVQGGVRVLTGMIGKANPSQFKLNTPVAVMGIRGTGFDTYYDTQTYVTVWQGAVTATRNGQTRDVALNQTLRIGNDGFDELQGLPQKIQSQFRLAPRPDTVSKQNIWVSVNTGNVTVVSKDKAQKNHLSKGETAVTNKRKSEKVPKSPAFVKDDPYTSASPDEVKQQGDKPSQQNRRESNNRNGNQNNNTSQSQPRGQNQNKGGEGENRNSTQRNTDKTPKPKPQRLGNAASPSASQTPMRANENTLGKPNKTEGKNRVSSINRNNSQSPERPKKQSENREKPTDVRKKPHGDK